MSRFYNRLGWNVELLEVFEERMVDGLLVDCIIRDPILGKIYALFEELEEIEGLDYN